MITIVFGTILPWLLIAIGTWLVYQIARQNDRILLRLESIEKQIGLRKETRAGAKRPEPSGLPVGTAAPDFELPDLTGARHKLSAFRGRDLLLIFFNPKCGFCTKMAVDLAALPLDRGDGRAVPVVITTGDAEQNRKLVDHYGIRCLVLLQQEMEVAAKYRAQGTLKNSSPRCALLSRPRSRRLRMMCNSISLMIPLRPSRSRSLGSLPS